MYSWGEKYNIVKELINKNRLWFAKEEVFAVTTDSFFKKIASHGCDY
jgi:hypothetical protein